MYFEPGRVMEILHGRYQGERAASLDIKLFSLCNDKLTIYDNHDLSDNKRSFNF